MSYKTRYTARWDSEKFGHDYRVEILERDYTGEVEVKRLGASPVLRMDDGENGVRGTSLELSVQADRDGELTTLYTTDNRRFRVDVFRDGVKVWTGYVLPEQYAEPYVGVPYDVAVTATDGLGILKSVPFELTGERTLLEIIDYCCGQTGLWLDYAIQDTLRETRMSEAEVMHVQTLYKAEAFEGMNCHEVLEAVMVSLDSVVTESECRWLVCSLTELEGDFRVYSPAGARKETGRLVTAELGRVGDEVYPIGSLDLEIVPAVKSVLFECDYGKRPSFLENYNFYHGKQGWTISSSEFVSHYYRNGEGVMRIRNDMSKPPSENYWNSIEQGVRLESSDDLTIRLKCALGVVGGEGDAWNYRVVVSFTAADGKGYFLSPGGWTEEYGYLDVKGRLCQVFVPEGYSSYTVDSFEEVTILASGVPSAGVLSIRLYNTYMHAPATEGEVILFVSEVAVTNEEVPEGVDLTAMLNESASTDGDDTELWLLDTPAERNGRLLYDRIVTGKSVGYTRAWKRGNSEEDSLMNLVVKSVCSRLAYPRRRLSGVIQGEELRPMMLVRDRWSGRVMAPVEASLDLVADEMSVTLEECMPFVELSGELDESERVTGGSSEYRSSGDNEKRVYQAGAGVPTRITDLQAETDPAGDDVMELDGTGWPRSKRVTLQVLAETFVRLVDAWTKGEMKLVDGYLTVLEQKIKAGWADDSDRWDGHEFGDWMDQPVRMGDGVTFRSVVAEVLRSMRFVDGFNGEGWQVWVDEDGVSRLTIDRLTVRQIMTVFEMVVERIRAVGGHLIVSAADGKIKTVEDLGEEYKITFEGMNYFQAHDLIRCHVYTGTTARGYWVEVSASTRDGIVVKKSEFEDWGTSPRVGDECVLMGNTVNRNRQKFISISATEDGQPRIDVMSGVNRKSLAGCLRARIGNLDGISDSWFPADNQPHGDGLYSDNAYLRGSFLLVTGEDVKTKFEIVEGKLSSAISGLRDEGVESGYLSNPNFTAGLLNWDTESDTVFFLSGGKWILANGSVLASKGDGVSVVLDSWRTALRIRNRYILQKNGNMKSLPEIPEKEDGSKKAVPVYFSFYYRCAREGILTVEFVGMDKTGFEDFEELHVEETIVPTSDYVQFVCQGFWNGTGDFKLSFSGDIYISVLVLSTDKADALAYRYETLFEQSDKLVRISAKNFDKDGNVIESSQIVTKADMNLVASGLFNEDGSLAEGAGLVTRKDVSALFAIGEDGTLKSFIGASTEGIKLKAASISLEGLVTANGGFSILEDGSVVAVAGKIGNLVLEGGALKSDNMLLSNEVLRFNNEHGDIYLNGHPDTVTGGETKLGTFIVKGGLYGGLKSTNKVALICSAPTTREYDFDFYNSYAIWACGTSVFGGVSLRDRQGVRSGEVTITPDDSVLLIDGDVTLNADEVLAKSGIVHTLLIVNVGEGEPTLHGTEGRDRVIRFRDKCCKVVAYANGKWYPHSDYKD